MVGLLKARELDDISTENILVWLRSYRDGGCNGSEEQRLFAALSFKLATLQERLNALEKVVQERSMDKETLAKQRAA